MAVFDQIDRFSKPGIFFFYSSFEISAHTPPHTKNLDSSPRQGRHPPPHTHVGAGVPEALYLFYTEDMMDGTTVVNNVHWNAFCK